MAFAVSTSIEMPTATTVASYKIDRLGKAPALSVRFTETLEEGVNTFGVPAQRPATAGRSWEIILSSANADQFTYMQQLLGSVSFKVVKAALAALNLIATDDQITTAIASIDNIDSVIASTLEQIEENRRLGVGPTVVVMGVAPPVTPA